MTFIKSDGGRSTSKRPKQKNDCTVKGAAIACRVPYDVAYDAIKALGRKCNDGAWLPTGKKTVRNGILLGHVWAWHGIPAPERGGKWPIVRDFVKTLDGRGILRVSKHVIAFDDGKWFDDFNSYEFATVRGYWIVTPI